MPLKILYKVRRVIQDAGGTDPTIILCNAISNNIFVEVTRNVLVLSTMSLFHEILPSRE